ncbi:hypothetical protein PR048_000046 [Dryococelus australis]|uniref:Uncharacterized protein n=1 Tax=Dryococelus australis TaxID=614101 RepID=A0ABQ9IDI8_9NEOP|nr:hypothetical protein PR048_000046 [Dryococelus australis]
MIGRPLKALRALVESSDRNISRVHFRTRWTSNTCALKLTLQLDRSSLETPWTTLSQQQTYKGTSSECHTASLALRAAGVIDACNIEPAPGRDCNTTLRKTVAETLSTGQLTGPNILNNVHGIDTRSGDFCHRDSGPRIHGAGRSLTTLRTRLKDDCLRPGMFPPRLDRNQLQAGSSPLDPGIREVSEDPRDDSNRKLLPHSCATCSPGEHLSQKPGKHSMSHNTSASCWKDGGIMAASPPAPYALLAIITLLTRKELPGKYGSHTETRMVNGSLCWRVQDEESILIKVGIRCSFLSHRYGNFADSFGNQLSVLEPQLSVLEPQINVLEPQLSELEPQLSELEPQLSELEPQLSVLEPQSSVLEPELSVLEPQLSVIEPQISVLEPQLSELEPKLAQHVENTARQFRALHVAAMANVMRVEMSPLLFEHFLPHTQIIGTGILFHNAYDLKDVRCEYKIVDVSICNSLKVSHQAKITKRSGWQDNKPYTSPTLDEFPMLRPYVLGADGGERVKPDRLALTEGAYRASQSRGRILTCGPMKTKTLQNLLKRASSNDLTLSANLGLREFISFEDAAPSIKEMRPGLLNRGREVIDLEKLNQLWLTFVWRTDVSAVYSLEGSTIEGELGELLALERAHLKTVTSALNTITFVDEMDVHRVSFGAQHLDVTGFRLPASARLNCVAECLKFWVHDDIIKRTPVWSPTSKCHRYSQHHENTTRSGDGSLVARASVTLIAPALLGPTRAKRGEYRATLECKGDINGRSPTKPRRPGALFATYENLGANPPGIVPGSPWCKASEGYCMSAYINSEQLFLKAIAYPVLGAHCGVFFTLKTFLQKVNLRKGNCCGGRGAWAASLLAPQQGEPGLIPGRASPGFSRVESRRTIPLVGGFPRGSPIYPVHSFRRCSILTSITLVGLRRIPTRHLGFIDFSQNILFQKIAVQTSSLPSLTQTAVSEDIRTGYVRNYNRVVESEDHRLHPVHKSRPRHVEAIPHTVYIHSGCRHSVDISLAHTNSLDDRLNPLKTALKTLLKKAEKELRLPITSLANRGEGSLHPPTQQARVRGHDLEPRPGPLHEQLSPERVGRKWWGRLPKVVTWFHGALPAPRGRRQSCKVRPPDKEVQPQDSPPKTSNADTTSEASVLSGRLRQPELPQVRRHVLYIRILPPPSRVSMLAPRTKANRALTPAGSLLDCRTWESCGFSPVSPVSPAHLISSSSAVKTPLLRAAQIFQLNSTNRFSIFFGQVVRA